MNRKDLFSKLYNKLLEEGFIDENNFMDECTCKREFIESVETFFKDYYLLDQLHEIE